MMQHYWKSSVETGITEKHENSQSLQDKIVQERNNQETNKRLVCVIRTPKLNQPIEPLGSSTFC